MKNYFWRLTLAFDESARGRVWARLMMSSSGSVKMVLINTNLIYNGIV